MGGEQLKPAVVLAGVFFLVFLCVAPGFVSAMDLDEFLTAVEAKAAPVNSFSCRFTQERHLAIFAKPVLFSGLLKMSRPRQLRWEFLKPIPSVLALKGTTGLRCSNGRSQRFELAADPVIASVVEQMWTWMDGSYRSLSQTWQIEYLPQAPGIRLVAKSAGVKAVMQAVRISFDRTTLRPVEIEIIDSGGDRTVLAFSEYVINPLLAETIFSQCGPPAQ